jgi:O-antigen/teichoic acid export membrane protein
VSLRESLRKLSGESLVYGIGQVSGRAVNLLLVPILTRVLLRQQFGVSELVTGYSASVLLVLVFGMDAALARFFYQQPDRATRVRMTSSSFAFRLATGLSVSLVLVLLAGPLAVGLTGSDAYAKYLRIGALTLPFTLTTLWCNDLLRVTFQPWKFVTLNVTQTALVGGVTLYLVLARGLGVAGVLYGKLCGDALAAVLGTLLCRHHIRPRFDGAILRGMLRYGLPLVPVAFAYGAIGSVDRWSLQHFASLDEVGVYAVALKFFAVVTLGVSAFQLAFMPFAFARAQDPESPRLYARVLGLYVAVASAGALLVGLAAPLGIRLLARVRGGGAAGAVARLCRGRTGCVLCRGARHQPVAPQRAARLLGGRRGARGRRREPVARAAPGRGGRGDGHVCGLRHLGGADVRDRATRAPAAVSRGQARGAVRGGRAARRDGGATAARRRAERGAARGGVGGVRIPGVEE